MRDVSELGLKMMEIYMSRERTRRGERETERERERE